jgi:hypothetical protein
VGLQVFEALRSLHTCLVHGDITTTNIVWDPSGHYFQFIDLEFSTWPIFATPKRGVHIESPDISAEHVRGECEERGEGIPRAGEVVARVVNGDMVVDWEGDGAEFLHGSTPAARLAAHGTLELAAFNQLKGCDHCLRERPSICSACACGPERHRAAAEICDVSSSSGCRKKATVAAFPCALVLSPRTVVDPIMTEITSTRLVVTRVLSCPLAYP